MALREFVDERGRRWTVWDVHPTLVARDLNVSQSSSPEERRNSDPKVQLPPGVAFNWLAFEASDGERRRLVPIPPCETLWSDAPEQQLCTWCEIAKQVPPTRRLIE